MLDGLIAWRLKGHPGYEAIQAVPGVGKDPNLGKAVRTSAGVRWHRISPGHSVAGPGRDRLNRYIRQQWM